MCGIAGIMAPAGRTVNGATLRAVGTALAHRGPDDEGYLGWTPGAALRMGGCEAADNARLGLTSRRLAILDLGPRGHQPMASACGRYALVYNGEVYNYRELRTELEATGARFQSETDTEVVLMAWAAWGSASVRRFVGMFAFALLDTADETLFLARDPFGMKPLFHADTPSGFAFASEIKALLAVPGVRRDADPQRTYEFLRFAVTDRGDRTFFAAIRQVPPAHVMAIREGQATSTRYWQPSLSRSRLSFGAAASCLRERFLETVSLHLRADVTVGAALSGGIDSSAVVSAMRHVYGPDLDLHTFTYAASAGACNEEAWASLAAREAHAIRHVCRVDGADLESDLGPLVRIQDEPFVSSSVLAQYRVFGAVKAAGIKVTLDGQGADEYLAGYPSFLYGRVASLLKCGRLHDAWTLLRHVGQGDSAAAGMARAVALMLPEEVRGLTRRIGGRPEFPSWMHRSWFDDRGTQSPALGKVRTRDAMLEQLQEAVTDISLPMLLRYADRNAMASSVESRMPFLTTSLMEFCLSLPEEYLLAEDGTTKAVFRAAMRGIVPDAILDRRDKVGFATPEHSWLLARRSQIESHLAATDDIPPFLNVPGLQSLWARARTRGEPDAVGATWRVVNLLEWSKAYGMEWPGVN